MVISRRPDGAARVTSPADTAAMQNDRVAQMQECGDQPHAYRPPPARYPVPSSATRLAANVDSSGVRASSCRGWFRRHARLAVTTMRQAVAPVDRSGPDMSATPDISPDSTRARILLHRVARDTVGGSSRRRSSSVDGHGAADRERTPRPVVILPAGRRCRTITGRCPSRDPEMI